MFSTFRITSPGVGGLLFHMEINVAAHHHGGQLLHGGLGGIHRADVLALAQHRAAVGYSHDLSQLMGDEQDRLALLPPGCA